MEVAPELGSCTGMFLAFPFPTNEQIPHILNVLRSAQPREVIKDGLDMMR